MSYWALPWCYSQSELPEAKEEGYFCCSHCSLWVKLGKHWLVVTTAATFTSLSICAPFLVCALMSATFRCFIEGRQMYFRSSSAGPDVHVDSSAYQHAYCWKAWHILNIDSRLCFEDLCGCPASCVSDNSAVEEDVWEMSLKVRSVNLEVVRLS